MSRLLVVATLIGTIALGVGAGAASARPLPATRVTIDAPARIVAGSAVAVTLRLPGRVAAVDGRILLDPAAAEVIGVAPVGKGVALATQEIDGGAAFGAYGLTARDGRPALRIVLAANVDGALRFRVVIDAAADADGNRVQLGTTRFLRTLVVTNGSGVAGAPRDVAPLSPRRAPGALRDVVADGVLSNMDIDQVRQDWELARANETACDGAAGEADVNADGCVDIVDLQALHAGQGRLIGGGPPTTASLSPTSRMAPAVAANAPAFTVTSTADTADENPGDGVCADSRDRCTLRAAVTESNWMRGENRILFNLSGSAPVVIQLTSKAPLIQDRTGGVEIDGYSQPGSRVNTATVGSNAIPGVEIRGTGSNPRGQALRITSADNVIRGLLLNNHYRPIYIDGTDAHDNRIVGNWIGFTASGAVHSYRGNHGVRLNNGAYDNFVGTPALADRNVIGNFTHAVDLYGPGTDSNIVQNNVLCMTPSGFGEASCSTGIDLNFGPKSNLYGGTGANEKNVIGRTTLNGIEISHGWDPDKQDTSTKWQNNNNRVIGNWIGFRGDGSYSASFRSGQNSPNSNDANGVNFYDGSNFNVAEGNWIGSVWDGINLMSPNSTGNTARNNIIGESPLGQAAPLNRYGIHVRNNSRSHVIEGNVIRNTDDEGIALTQKDVLWVRISRNIITDTSASAIFITQGANNSIPAPVITSATSVRASGTGIPGATVEVFRASRSAGQSGLPVVFLGSTVVGPDGRWTLPIVVEAGQRVVALQINSVNNTSMLGTNVTATFESPPAAPEADFGWSQRASTLIVDFSDASTNAPAQWSWNFGDGTTSSEQNPSKTYGQPGQYTVSLTVTNGGGSDSISKQVTVEPPPSATTIAADAFGRTLGGWGNADVGGPYTLQGSSANYNVGSGVGTMRLPSAGASRAALLNGVSHRDVDIKVRASVDKVAAGGNYFVYAVARRNGSSEYRSRLVFHANGTVSVNASVVVSGSESSLGAPVVVSGLGQGPNQFIWLRAQVTGTNPTTIRVKAWADGQAEPSGWNFTVSNSQAAVQTAGGLGLRTYIAGKVTTAPVVVSFDDYSAVDAP